METDILQHLQDLGYKGPLLDAEKFSKEVELGAKSVEFTSLVAWLAGRIGEFSNVEENIHPTASADDASSFLLELSSFLKETGCVNQQLISGNVNQRLATKQDKLNLLEFLSTELMTCKILKAQQPEDTSMEITISESDTAKLMKEMLLALKIQKPPDNITPEMLFQKLVSKTQEVMQTVPIQVLSKPLFIGELSNDQWKKLDQFHRDLETEFKIRREMLLKRFEVTINSFLWSDRVKSKEDQLNKCYYTQRSKIKVEPSVTLADLLTSREDLAIIEKTSSASVRKNTRSQVNQVIIGAVPDRGGRTAEQEPPPPEMPAWQKDRVQGPQSGGGGRGGGRGRGRGGGDRGRGGGGGHKDASRNFGQNQDNYQQQQPQAQFSSNYGNRGGGHHSGYQTEQRGGFYGNQRNDQRGGYQDQRGGYQVQHGGYQQDQRGGGYQDQQGGFYNDQRGYQQDQRGQRGGGRVQGGWNQGDDNRSSNYQRGGHGGQRY